MTLHGIAYVVLTSVMLGCSEGNSDNNISKGTVNGVTWGYTVYKDGEACLGNSEHLSKTISTSTSGCIPIPTTLGGHRVVGICEGAFADCRKLSGIIIPSGITTIGDGAFMNCTGLENITIPDSVKYIGGCLFDGCNRLTSVRLPDAITELPVGIFNGCVRLRSFTIPGNVKTIEPHAFQRSGITNIMIHGNVKCIMDSAFEGCNSLTEVTIGEGVESLWHDAFANCKNLSHVVIPQSITFIGEGAFKFCDNLTHVEIPVNMSEENVRRCWFKSGVKISHVNKPKTKSNVQGSDTDASR